MDVLNVVVSGRSQSAKTDLLSKIAYMLGREGYSLGIVDCINEESVRSTFTEQPAACRNGRLIHLIAEEN